MLGQKDKLLLGVKQLALFGAVLGLVFGTGAVSFGDASASGNDKIYICYKDKDKKIKEKNLNKYLKKGATLGKCHDDGGDDDRHGDDKKQDDYKVYVCHDGKDKKINLHALKAHLKHGDSEGKCEKDDDKHDDDKKFKKHKVFTGDGPPPKKLGKKGDLYFDTRDIDGLDYYVKIKKKVWEFRGIIVEVNSDCAIRDIIKFDDSKWVCADDLVDDDDADPANELQTLTQSGSDVTLSQGGGTVSIDDADADSTNEIQDPNPLANRDLSLSLGSTSITLPFALDNQSCGANEAIIGFDVNGVRICGTVAGDVSLITELVFGDAGSILPANDEDFEPLEGSLTCTNGGVVSSFNVLVVSGNGIAAIESLDLIAQDTVDYTISNPGVGSFVGEGVIDGESVEINIPGPEIDVIPYMFCVNTSTP